MRSLMVALPFVIVALFWDNKKILSVVMFLVIIYLCIFSTQLRSFNEKINDNNRLTINYISMLIIKEHPITGIGYSMETLGNKELIDH